MGSSSLNDCTTHGVFGLQKVRVECVGVHLREERVKKKRRKKKRRYSSHNEEAAR